MPYKDRQSPAAIASRRKAQKKHYDANRQAFIDKSARYRESLRSKLRELKDGPCADCGHKYPWYCMQFDHINDDKEANVSMLVNQGYMTKLLAEVAKCELVCANCHAIRTYKRMNP